MHLKSIKLAGFKTFIDPTTVDFSEGLSAIVGPNGCGKSNIIDAVKWVMGESAPRSLRSSAMADVIFSGSGSRPRASRASIELLFDNSDERIGGRYASFTTVSVRRQITTEGASRYFLNGQHCRRRDIADIFSGTGLGPGGYSIIGQGLISDLIEARPDELRVYLEEAAGISRYKEQRRETESRIKQSYQNLERLGDLREEAEKSLQHLERQVKTANRYQKLKAHSNKMRAELLYLKWQTFENDKRTNETQLKESRDALAQAQSRMNNIDTKLAVLRTGHDQLNNKLTKALAANYEFRAAIAREEVELKTQQQRDQQIRKDLQENAGKSEQAATGILQDEAQSVHLAERLSATESAFQEAKSTEHQTQQEWQNAEDALTAWQDEWHAFQARNVTDLRAFDLQRSNAQHQKVSTDQLEQQIRRLESEQANLKDDQTPSQQADQMALELSKIDAQTDALQQGLEKKTTRCVALKETLAKRNAKLHQLRRALEKLQGQQAALEERLANEVDTSDAQILQWLEAADIRQPELLSQCLQVEPPWEAAVENVLGGLIYGVMVENLEALGASLDELKQGKLAVVETTSVPAKKPKSRSKSAHGLPPLAHRLPADSPAALLLAGVYEAPDINTAMAARARLADHESIITPDCLWLGKSWLKIQKQPNEQIGVLARAKKLKQVQAALRSSITETRALQKNFDKEQAQLAALEGERDEEHLLLTQLQAKRATLDGDYRALQAHDQIRLSRTTTITQEIESFKKQIKQEQERSRETQKLLTKTTQEVKKNEQESSRLGKMQENLRKKFEETKAVAAGAANVRHGHDLERQRLTTEHSNALASIQKLSAQKTEFFDREEGLKQALETVSAALPSLQKSLGEKLTLSADQEKKLQQIREQLEQSEKNLGELSSTRGEAENETEQYRTKAEQAHIQNKTLEISQTNQLEQLETTGYTIADIRAGLPEQANEEKWRKEISNIEDKIGRLGGINLAAAEEYDTRLQRKTCLDAQNEDITTALATLKEAIRKIDRETSARFKQTFDKVNEELKRFFPKCFGGGVAYLEMTGDDLLNTGISIMARPPGKKNASVHLLSGGEKALTAIALVFSIFGLNPAPLCILDEVDASLDDTNVLHYIGLLQEMSKNMQFIYVTHNKTSIEAAKQLIGVTMRESGVSKLVSVDMETATAAAMAGQ